MTTVTEVRLRQLTLHLHSSSSFEDFIAQLRTSSVLNEEEKAKLDELDTFETLEERIAYVLVCLIKPVLPRNEELLWEVQEGLEKLLFERVGSTEEYLKDFAADVNAFENVTLTRSAIEETARDQRVALWQETQAIFHSLEQNSARAREIEENRELRITEVSHLRSSLQERARTIGGLLLNAEKLEEDAKKDSEISMKLVRKIEEQFL